MGSLTIRIGGRIYLDTPSVIYTVEHHPIYEPILDSVWDAAEHGTVEVVTSELTLLEALVLPQRHRNQALVTAYELLLSASESRMIPITQSTLRRAIPLRAELGLKTPDAIHAATALDAGCTLFVTNDPHFRRVIGLEVAVLDDIVAGRQAP
jgi:predicted nucleic acid-binding protein